MPASPARGKIRWRVGSRQSPPCGRCPPGQRGSRRQPGYAPLHGGEESRLTSRFAASAAAVQ
ncbi:hypothetical protein EN836_30845 [Mesorhizobium sp. M1C.F.Ca.ET.193.01.1.1]|nr:hypothetical protein EN853_30835 [Mesorhizobium sp. M1C.F.Ca.ET.210.01.1.1]TGQ64745.1 hypothetical protein EN855_030850 [Mesorhizobium sp. M1C.F.Ca.ET.212.01.1.1]TGQ98361.1 hypothetical protein EN847_30835 [Mesorhizobium sp. M1C.F.Ca.ET.204.01.1.1]TGR18666.1 hypothetical protein EN839_30835 [Mesorhizobium sp. M1C.F.Ca.ET.196.01.1.1]TGR40964.1 hypothetical protein EN838_30840 [Mesorhizobium sp. M1C.F.Ca.ET.195.01.1.1]TGR60964.1 hypothetical protein EN835_030825 [Mesorhizobium sp. M1C.F.Ca.ET